MDLKRTVSSRTLLIVLALVLAAISTIFLLFRGMSRNHQDTNPTFSAKQNAAASSIQHIHAELVPTNRGSAKQNAGTSSTQPQSAIQLSLTPDPGQIAMKVNSLIIEAQNMWQINPGEAQRVLDDAINLGTNNFEATYQLARFLTQKKDFPAAIQQYQKALQLNDQVPEIYFNLGYIYTIQSAYNLARMNYESCLNLSPPYRDEVLTNMGMVELKRNNTTDARLLFQQALDFNPKNGLARNNLNKMSNHAEKSRNMR
jgi:serine/threonine-protein kinase